MGTRWNLAPWFILKAAGLAVEMGRWVMPLALALRLQLGWMEQSSPLSGWLYCQPSWRDLSNHPGGVDGWPSSLAVGLCQDDTSGECKIIRQVASYTVDKPLTSKGNDFSNSNLTPEFVGVGSMEGEDSCQRIRHSREI